MEELKKENDELRTKLKAMEEQLNYAVYLMTEDQEADFIEAVERRKKKVEFMIQQEEEDLYIEQQKDLLQKENGIEEIEEKEEENEKKIKYYYYGVWEYRDFPDSDSDDSEEEK